MNDDRAMKVRSYLYLLVTGTLMPLVILASVAALLLLQHQREATERDAIGRARAAMSAVDAQLEASIVSLETLAASKNLESGRIAAFHAESQRVLRTQPSWVNIGLATAAKVQLSNAVYAFDKPAPFATDDDSFAAVLRGARAGFGGVAAGSAVRNPTVRVRVPVAYGGKVRYVITAPLNLKHLAELLQAQRLPEGWIVFLADREGRAIVGIPTLAAGASVPDGFREAPGRATEGWLPGHELEGRLSYTAYVTSPLSGWVLGIAIPASTVEADARLVFALMGAGVLLALAVGGLLAWLIARHLPH